MWRANHEPLLSIPGHCSNAFHADKLHRLTTFRPRFFLFAWPLFAASLRPCPFICPRLSASKFASNNPRLHPRYSCSTPPLHRRLPSAVVDSRVEVKTTVEKSPGCGRLAEDRCARGGTGMGRCSWNTVELSDN